MNWVVRECGKEREKLSVVVGEVFTGQMILEFKYNFYRQGG